MAVIETIGLTKIYNETIVPVKALHEVDLSFDQGEFTSIVGPSGSGKTTLLNMLGGLDKPSSGQILINRKDITTLKERQLTNFRLQHIGFVFQSYNLIPVLTAIENVSFIMLLQKHSRKKIDQRAREILEQVGLGDRLNARPSQLSGGQQQRVAVARALASRPDFVLADEPTANLDTQSAFNLLDIMEKLNREENITLIFSTHDQRVIERARRVITLVDGAVAGDEKRQQ
ncbi:MAG TPA: ABC transporter ATP-binding protein [Bacteroidales bacterium]|jgi:putative ABC transport system ATP-binding protein|nr:ABC transporter ATP-binding protein [Bacteroidales bacterium]MDD4087659.1 ABC transporter ATP-binding protein [Bacteroidales bacterium]MDY0085553.1 ABC transporter ATP-binding protein [Bacteroidales bacterium]HPE43294.1 ABC transporter ATP-binding protein [Bacteroidales bacterium]